MLFRRQNTTILDFEGIRFRSLDVSAASAKKPTISKYITSFQRVAVISPKAIRENERREIMIPQRKLSIPSCNTRPKATTQHVSIFFGNNSTDEEFC